MELVKQVVNNTNAPLTAATLRLLQLVSLDEIFEKVQAAMSEEGVQRSKKGKFAGAPPCQITFDAEVKTDRSGRVRRCWRCTQARIGTVKGQGGFEVYVWTKCAHVLYLLQLVADAEASPAAAQALRQESKTLFTVLTTVKWG